MNITDKLLMDRDFESYNHEELIAIRDGLISARQTIAEQAKRIKLFADCLRRGTIPYHDKHPDDKSFPSGYVTIAWLMEQVAALTAERNAWREDADSGHMWLETYHEHLVFDKKCETCLAMMRSLDHHRQLHERYSTEKSDTAKGERNGKV